MLPVFVNSVFRTVELINTDDETVYEFGIRCGRRRAVPRAWVNAFDLN